MEVDPLPDIIRILLEAGVPPAGIEEKARAWASVRPLVINHRRAPNPTFHEGWELRLVTEEPARAVQLARVLRQLGIVPIRPFARDDREVPVFSRDQWIVRLLELGAKSSSPYASSSRPAVPEPQDEVARILLRAGLTADDLDEAVRAWRELLPLAAPPETGDSPDKKRPIQFIAASPVGAARIEERLHRLGIKPERPHARQDRIVVPVNGKRYPWLVALLALGQAPSEPSSAGS